MEDGGEYRRAGGGEEFVSGIILVRVVNVASVLAASELDGRVSEHSERK